MAEQQPPVPTTYRERLAQFKILEEKRFELIEVTLQFVLLSTEGRPEAGLFCDVPTA